MLDIVSSRCATWHDPRALPGEGSSVVLHGVALGVIHCILRLDGLLMQGYFSEESVSKKRSYADMYELVQHAGNVLPRLCAPPAGLHMPR